MNLIKFVYTPYNEEIRECSLTRAAFLRKVRKQHLIFQRYSNSTKLRPFFDYDCKFASQPNPESIESINQENIKLIKSEFPEGSIAVAQNSRQSGDQFKVSFHYIVNGYWSDSVNLYKLCKKWNHFDHSVYPIHNLNRDGNQVTKIFRFSNQAKHINDTPPIVNSPLEMYIIFASDSDSIHYTCDFFVEINANPVNIPKLREPHVYPHDPVSKKQAELMLKLLLELPIAYATNGNITINNTRKNYWNLVGVAIHHWACGSITGLNLFVSFSLRSKVHANKGADYVQSNCETWYHKINHDKPGPTIAFLVKAHKVNCKEWPAKDYNQLDIIQPFKLIDEPALLKSGVQITHFNTRYMSQAGIVPNDETVIIGNSPTGSGKTYFANLLRQGLLMLSVTSRTSLACAHKTVFDIELYTDIKKQNRSHGLNEVIQLDSLLLLQNYFDIQWIADGRPDFFLVLDEVNSLMPHLLNDMKHMPARRIKILKLLEFLINHAKFVFAIDADVTTHVVNFIQAITYKRIHLYINDFIEIKPTPVFFIHNVSNLRNNCFEIAQAFINNGMQGETFILFADSKKNLLKHFIAPFFIQFPQLKHLIKVFTHDQGSDNDLLHVNTSLPGCFVFSSPRIIYGIDISFPAHVISYNSINQLNAHQVNQQINRVRNPISISVLASNSSKIRFHSQFEIDNECKTLVDIADINSDSDCKYSRALNQLKKKDIFLNEILTSNLQFHVAHLLKQKGYTNVIFGPKYAKKTIYKAANDDELALYKTHANSIGDTRVSDAKNQTMDMLRKYIPAFDSFNLSNSLLNFANTVHDNPNIAKTIENYHQYHSTRFATLPNGKIVFQNSHDTDLLTTLSIQAKFLYFAQLCESLAFDPFDWGDRSEDIKLIKFRSKKGFYKNRISEQLISVIIAVYRFDNRSKKICDAQSYHNNVIKCYDLMLNCAHHLFPHFFNIINVEYKPSGGKSKKRNFTRIPEFSASVYRSIHNRCFPDDMKYPPRFDDFDCPSP